MNKQILLLITCFLAMSLGSNAQMLFDFENNVKMNGWGTDITGTIVTANPVITSENGSDKCQKIVFTETWGRVHKNGLNVNLKEKALTFLVYSENIGEVSVYTDCTDPHAQITQAILEKNKWVRVFFDFSNKCSTATEIQIGTGTKNTIYIDDVQLIPLSEVPSPTVCNEMEIPYSYGTLAIGGGGFVSGLIASPTAKDVKFARTDVGGAYKWNAANCSWKPLTNFISEDDKGLLSIEALAIDPSNANNIYMLAGSEYFSNAKTAIMISNDGGKSFETKDVSSLMYVHGNGNGRGNGERIAVDPNNSNIIIAGGRAGAGNPLIKSADGGKTWSVLSTFPSSVFTASVPWPNWVTEKSYKTTANKNGISAVVFDGTKKESGKTQRIFVGVSKTGAANVYMSEDGGNSWSAIANLQTNWMPLRMKMDPAGNLLIAYASAEGPNNSQTLSGGIYRYNPNTKTATNISPSGGYAIGDVTCSRTSSDSLVCTTICQWKDQDWETGEPVQGDIIFTSTDGGKTWRSLQNKFRFDANGCSWIPDHAIHWSCSILMDPFDNNKVSVTSGNGIFTTNNIWCEAQNGPTFYFDVNGLEETVPLDLVSVPAGDVYSVIGDYTGFRHENIHAFAPIHKPESGSTSGITYAAKQINIMARVSKENIYYSEDYGVEWTTNPTSEKTDGDERKIAISADGKVLVFIGKHGCSYSTDKAKTWIASAGITNPKYIIADPVNENYIYAANEKTFYVSADKGKTFSATSLEKGDFPRFAVVPGKEGLIYAPCGGNGLKVSKDYGATFTEVSYVTACNAVGVGVGKTAGTYMLYMWGKANGCEMGIYCSEDEGNSWKRINDANNQFGGPGNGQFIVGDMNTYGRFYMSTVGLGIVYGDLAATKTEASWTCFVDNTECKVEPNPNPVGINPAQPSNRAMIEGGPNPFTETFTLKTSGAYSVTNIAGQIIEHGISNGNTPMGSTWNAGIYFIKINNSIIKVIKK